MTLRVLWCLFSHVNIKSCCFKGTQHLISYLVKRTTKTASHQLPSSPCIRSLACWDTFLQASPSNEKSPCLIFFMISSALVWVRLFSWHWKGTWPDSMVYCKHRKNKGCKSNLNIFNVAAAQKTCLLCCQQWAGNLTLCLKTSAVEKKTRTH